VQWRDLSSRSARKGPAIPSTRPIRATALPLDFTLQYSDSETWLKSLALGPWRSAESQVVTRQITLVRSFFHLTFLLSTPAFSRFLSLPLLSSALPLANMKERNGIGDRERTNERKLESDPRRDATRLKSRLSVQETSCFLFCRILLQNHEFYT